MEFGTPDYLAKLGEGLGARAVAPDLTRATSHGFGDNDGLLAASDGEPGGVFYARYGHPNSLEAEARVAVLEGAEGCVSYPSGMAAISAVFLSLLRAGDRLALSHYCYGGTMATAARDLPRFGIEVLRFDPFDEASVDEVLVRAPALVHVESPVNPTVRVVDVPKIAAKAHAASARLSVDGTFLPPPYQKLTALGADLAVHSATKSLGGHSDLLGGVVCGRIADLEILEAMRRRTSAPLPPDSAWLLVRSLETLVPRFDAQARTAARVASWLAEEGSRRGVATVHYPGLASHRDHAVAARDHACFGSMLAFEMAGGYEAAKAVYGRFRVFRRAASLGGVHSLACLPVDTSHRALSEEELEHAGFSRGTIRLSVGIEDADDVIADLDAAVTGSAG